jgi:hypothetical protein
MRSKVTSVLIFSIVLVLSFTLIFVSSGLSKREPNLERITFSGHLYGDQEVEGCCGNAGPFPEYTMTLSGEFPPTMLGKHEGKIFMNSFGRNMPWAYKVQFWWTESDTEYFIEIRGGEKNQDKKTKILTVVFTGEECNIWIDDVPQLPVTVTFTLTRDPHHPAKK